MFHDKSLACRDCGAEFLFSKGEQEFFSLKGLTNEPKRCPNCRVLLRVQRSGKDVTTTSEVTCANCGTSTRVPFQPRGHRPVYCAGCMQTKKAESARELLAV